MSQVGQGEVVVFPTFKGFRTAVVSEVDTAGSEGGSKFSTAFGNAIKGIGAGIAVGVGAAIAGVAAIAGKGLSRALNIQDAQAQLTGLGHSAETVTAIMGNALASVKGTAFGLDTAATVAASAVASGIKPGADLERTLKNVADAATIAKTDMGSMGSIFNKVASSNKLQGDVINQLADRGIPILQLLSTQLGVTTEDVLKMSQEGTIDFATFQAAMEAGLGGAALASGATARGAWANVQSALGRLGAMFTGGAVAGAPVLFTAISNAVDRLATALAPAAEQFSGALAPAIASVSGWIDRIDFGKVVNGLHEFFLGAVDVKDLLLTGFTENETLLPPGLVTGLRIAHDVFVAVGDAFKDVVSAFQSGDFSGPLSSMGASFTTLKPALSEFASQIPNIGGAVAELGAAVLPILSGALGFLADNVDTIIQFMPLIVAGFIAWKVATGAAATASIALRTAEVAALPGQIARNGLRLAAAGLEYQVATATSASTTAEVTATGARNAGILANVRAAAATVASRVAMAAGAVATGIATAAQWAFNAALSANPIALIIIGIAALVAGLVWFFTQTEVGKQAWASFTQFLAEAWANIQAVATVVWTAISEFLSAVWAGIVGFVTAYINTVLSVIQVVTGAISAVWNTVWSAISAVFSFIWTAIVAYVTTYINVVMTIIRTVLAVITGVWSTVWTGISTVLSAIWTGIVTFVTAYINTVMAIITAVLNVIRGTWSAVWEGISAAASAVWGGIVSFITGFINVIRTIIATVLAVIVAIFTGNWDAIAGIVSGAWDKIRTIVSGMVSGIQDAIGGVGTAISGVKDKVLGVLSGAGNWLKDSGRAIIQGFIDGIKGMIGKVGDAIGGVMDFVGGFFPHSPAKRGEFSGSGWRAVKSAGLAIGDEFGAGLADAEPSLNAQLGAMLSGSALKVAVSGSGSGRSTERPLTLEYHQHGGTGIPEEDLFVAGRRLKARI